MKSSDQIALGSAGDLKRLSLSMGQTAPDSLRNIEMHPAGHAIETFVLLIPSIQLEPVKAFPKTPPQVARDKAV